MKSKETIKGMIIKNPEGALEYMQSVVDKKEDNDTYNAVLLIGSQLSDLKSMEIKGIIAPNDFTLALQKIRNNILNAIEQAADIYFAEDEEDDDTPKDAAYLLDIFALLRDLAELKIIEVDYLTNPIRKDAGIGSYTNVKRHIILNQIIKLLKISKVKLSSVEYRIIAEAFKYLLDDVKAEEFYKKAIATINEFTDSTNSKIVAIRSYGNFLYGKGKAVEGFKQYESALLDANNEQSNVFNAYTYQLLFGYEADFKNYESAVEIYKKAKDCSAKIQNPVTANNYLQTLSNLWDTKKIPAAFKKP